jgi:Antibiotic biosynthesis monooxygenase
MTAFNVVRFRVKPGQEKAFENKFRNVNERMEGMRKFSLIKTGDRTYCSIGEWDAMQNIVNARPAMISDLDEFRSMLEDLGGGLGVTDPVSGETVVEISGRVQQKVA